MGTPSLPLQLAFLAVVLGVTQGQDPCSPNPCKHNGLCTSAGNQFYCYCGFTGYIGATCEILDRCNPNPCKHNGRCSSGSDGSYYCNCGGTGYIGQQCEILDPCNPNPCKHNGQCSSGNDGSYYCNCGGTGYIGQKCEILDPCNPTPCQHNGRCSSGNDGSYYCDCSGTGYNGVNCELGSGIQNDPLIRGFDGSVFHFDYVGDFALVENGDGLKVHATFSSASGDSGSGGQQSHSWTTSVRVLTPDGDMVACALPYIFPNTSNLEVTVTYGHSPKDVVTLSRSRPTVNLTEVSASLIEAGQQPYQGLGCNIVTSTFEIVVHQISGYEQAQAHPGIEDWAAPYTWLNTDIHLLKPLLPPVTGILGSTYPMEKLLPKHTQLLNNSGEVGELTAIVEDDVRFGRNLASADDETLSSNIVGLSVAGLVS